MPHESQTDAPVAEEPKANGQFITVDLEEPLALGDTPIASITLRKPKSGELRGLSLDDLVNADVTTILKLIPRISNPVIIEEKANELDPVDLGQIGGAIRGFFMTKAQRAMMDRMIEDALSKS